MTRLMLLVAMLALAGMAPAQTAAEIATVPQTRTEIGLSMAPVVRRAAPSVVNIYARQIVTGRGSPFAGDPFFDQFFRGFGVPAPRVENSLGSGVIVSPDGLVVSNHHVVGSSSEITVVLNDRREYAADVVLADRDSDLAVLRLRDAHDLPAKLSVDDRPPWDKGELTVFLDHGELATG